MDDLPVDSPRVKVAMEQLTLAAIDHALDTLDHGSTPERTAVMKMILGDLLKSKAGEGAGEAERILEEARGIVSGILPRDDH